MLFFATDQYSRNIFFSRTQLRAFNGELLYEGTAFIFSVDMVEEFSFLLYFYIYFLIFLEL